MVESSIHPITQSEDPVSFMAKVKQFMGIGGVKIVLTVPDSVERAKGLLEGKLTLTSKSDQQLQEIEVKLVESWSTGRGDDKTTKEFDLGKVTVPGFALKAGESRELPFTLSFEMIKSNADELKEKGGALGALGKAAAFANAEKSTFRVVATGDVKGTAFGPTDGKDIRLI